MDTMMTCRRHRAFLLLAAWYLCAPSLWADTAETAPKEHCAPSKQQMSLSFEQEPIRNIINTFAARKGINIVLPQGDNELQQKLSFQHSKDNVSLEEAEYYIHLFLNMAGYHMYQEKEFFVVAPKTENNAARHPVDLYVNVDPDVLPQSQETIQAIYYLSRMRVPESTGVNSPINTLIKDMLGTKKGHMFDKEANGIIMVGPAHNIASIVRILRELDTMGSAEVVEAIPLYNAGAQQVSQILSEHLIAKTGQGGSQKAQTGADLYFAPNTRVIPDTQHNRIILMGKEASLNKIREFIRDYLDAPPESGESVIHVYDLQYLDARKFAPTLKKIVQQSASGQSQKSQGGPYKSFDNVIVVAEEVQKNKAEGGGSSTQADPVEIGGNRLLVASTSKDWEFIRPIIEKLDKPDYQVILEVMIVDLTVNTNKKLRSQTRNPDILNLHDTDGINANFQTAHVANTVLDQASNPKTVASDLLRLLDGSQQSIARGASTDNNVGSTLISFADPCDPKNGIWSILQILDRWSEQTILSHPFFVTKNNVAAHEERITKRRESGGLDESGRSTVTTIKEEDFDATLKVSITPRVSSHSRLNLGIGVTIEDFIPGAGFARTTREISTNANVKSGQVLVLGGLTRDATGADYTQWPLISRIPIIGNFFKGNAQSNDKQNLLIFIHPTVVEPKLEGGINRYTDEKVQQSYDWTQKDTAELFSQFKDPVTRFFFGKATQHEEALTRFLQESEYSYQSASSKSDIPDHARVSGEDLETRYRDMQNPFVYE